MVFNVIKLSADRMDVRTAIRKDVPEEVRLQLCEEVRRDRPQGL